METDFEKEVEEVTDKQQEPEKTEEAPKWLPKRLARERKTALSELAKNAGFETIDTMLDFIEKAKEEVKTVNTEVTKKDEAVKASDESGTNLLATLENRLKEMEEKLEKEKEAKLKSHVEKRITENVAKYAEFPEDVVRRVLELKPFSDFVNDKGDVDDNALNEAIENVKKERPNFFRKTIVGSPSNKPAAVRLEDEKIKTEVQKIDNSIKRAF